MNRRQSLRALALSSIGAAAPFQGWTHTADNNQGETESLFPSEARGMVKAAGSSSYGDIFLIASAAFIEKIRPDAPSDLKFIDYKKIDESAIVNRLAKGATMIWIGRGDTIPKQLSVGYFNISDAEVNVKPSASSPVINDDIEINKAVFQSAFISPPKEMPLHNIDEEVRADFLPIWEAYNEYGDLVGYPAVAMSYFSPSLAGGRFKGSECFFFLTDDPLKIINSTGWKNILDKIYAKHNSGLQLVDFTTNYASYKPGERIQIITRIQNRRPKAVSATMRLYLQFPGSTEWQKITETRRVAETNSETQAICDIPVPDKIGLFKIKLEVLQDVENAEKLAYTKGDLQIIDQREIGFLIIKELSTVQLISFDGPHIKIENKNGFWSGTHYYPSTSWWEWVWRDFRVNKAAEDFAAIRKAGYRIVRVWIDPILDEPVLRAMDAAIQLAANFGIVLDICVFTQWVRYIGFERKSGEQVTFEFRNPKDFNIVSFSLRNIDLQREYIQVLGARWKNAGNIFYNIANEVYIKEPDHSQMDEEVINWPENKQPAGTKRDTLLFNRWAAEMTKALRSAGAQQPAMPGYMFSTMNGGDVYLGNKNSPVIPWHSYLPTEQTALTIQYFDPLSSNRPLLLEEFGTLGWNNKKNYDENVHYALAAGAAAAMSYEWGVSWLCRESCYWPIPLLEATSENPDPRWFGPYTELHKTWSENGVGLCATPSGTGYGSIYHGTPFPAEAAVALGRLGLIGEGLQRGKHPEKMYVIIPEANNTALEKTQAVLKDLWRKKIIFGIWQEADIDKLPAGVNAVICAVSLTNGMSAIKTKGTKVFEGTDSWKSFSGLEKVMVEGGDNLDLLSRRTEQGLLFTLINKGDEKNISVDYNAVRVNMGISDFALVHYSKNGVILWEGTGTLQVNGKTICSISRGRVIMAAEDGRGLQRSTRIKLIITEPATLVFKRKITSVSISDGLNQAPRKIGFRQGQQLAIDDQLAKYVLHLSF